MSGLGSIQNVAKTTKLFINGEFPRTESGRALAIHYHNTQKVFAQICQGSRKDVRAAVEAAAGASRKWSGASAYNRGQVLYRMAEMFEGKRSEITDVIIQVLGLTAEQAKVEVDGAVDELVYYAGFSDKFAQVLGSINPVSGPFHNFTSPEAVGVVGFIYDKSFKLAEFVGQLAAILCSGNTVIAVFDQPGAALLSELGEVCKTSDLPSGVVNLISGSVSELAAVLGQHMEVQSLCYCGENSGRIAELKQMATENMKRVVILSSSQRDLHTLLAFTEMKTVWYPVGL